MDFRPFYYDLSTNKVISGNSYYEIINNLTIFATFKVRNILFCHKINYLFQSLGCTAERGLCILQCRPRTRLINSKCTFQILGGCQGRRTGVGVTIVSNSLILGGWVTKVLKNGDKK